MLKTDAELSSDRVCDMRSAQHKGFTLIELMVVVLIIGIIAGIAYPNYSRFVIDSRRTAAQNFLLQAAAQQEKFYTQCGYYASGFSAVAGANVCGAGAGTGVLGMTASSNDVEYYNPLTIAVGPSGDIATSFALTAAPNGPQLTNDTCGSITYNSAGQKGRTGSAPMEKCWKK
jgi:type IV pilus assembly protein PilE